MITIDQCPIIKPTAEEFENFEQFVESIETSYGKSYGMVKVIPPKTFKARHQDYSKSIENLIVQGPIEQNVYGKGGIYECLLIQKKSMLLKDFRKKQQLIDDLRGDRSKEAVEQEFWKNLAFSPPLYGADIKISLMDTKSSWNLQNIHSILNEGLQKKISGVNEPYIYVGSWKSFFAWHKEDMDLDSTNYLHYGKPKFWYSISETDGHYLESYAKQHFAEHFTKCPEYLRHKTTIINPYLLKQQYPQVKISKVTQNEGEFVFLFSGAYHAGFNSGFNIAEAVNYATLTWLDLLPKAAHCKCVRDSVSINVQEFTQNLSLGPYRNHPQVVNLLAAVKKKFPKDTQPIIQKTKKSIKKSLGKRQQTRTNTIKIKLDKIKRRYKGIIIEYI